MVYRHVWHMCRLTPSIQIKGSKMSVHRNLKFIPIGCKVWASKINNKRRSLANGQLKHRFTCLERFLPGVYELAPVRVFNMPFPKVGFVFSHTIWTGRNVCHRLTLCILEESKGNWTQMVLTHSLRHLRENSCLVEWILSKERVKKCAVFECSC